MKKFNSRAHIQTYIIAIGLFLSQMVFAAGRNDAPNAPITQAEIDSIVDTITTKNHEDMSLGEIQLLLEENHKLVQQITTDDLRFIYLADIISKATICQSSSRVDNSNKCLETAIALGGLRYASTLKNLGYVSDIQKVIFYDVTVNFEALLNLKRPGSHASQVSTAFETISTIQNLSTPELTDQLLAIIDVGILLRKQLKTTQRMIEDTKVGFKIAKDDPRNILMFEKEMIPSLYNPFDIRWVDGSPPKTILKPNTFKKTELLNYSSYNIPKWTNSFAQTHQISQNSLKYLEQQLEKTYRRHPEKLNRSQEIYDLYVNKIHSGHYEFMTLSDSLKKLDDQYFNHLEEIRTLETQRISDPENTALINDLEAKFENFRKLTNQLSTEYEKISSSLAAIDLSDLKLSFQDLALTESDITNLENIDYFTLKQSPSLKEGHLVIKKFTHTTQTKASFKSIGAGLASGAALTFGGYYIFENFIQEKQMSLQEYIVMFWNAVNSDS